MLYVISLLLRYTPAYGSHLGYLGQNDIETNVRIGILVIDLVEKVYLYLILAALVQKLFFEMQLAATSDNLVEMVFETQTDVRIGTLMVDLVGKVYLYLILAALVQKLMFQNGAGGHFGFGPLAKNACIFARGRVSKFFIKRL